MRTLLATGKYLETFLGGMETPSHALRIFSTLHLETFLGGMETRIPGERRAPVQALKPSLVEWKLKLLQSN